MTILSVNQDQVILHFVGSGNVNVTGNNTVSNLTSNSSEIVLQGAVYQIWYGCDGGGSWQIVSGNSTQNSSMGTFSGTGHAPFGQAGESMALFDSGELLYVTLDGSTNGAIMIDLRKESSF